MIDLILLITLLILAIIDIKTLKVFNALSFPIIFIATIYTGLWLQVICSFFLMALVLKEEPHKKWGVINWCGGDVKLFMIIAAFKGWLFIPILISTEMLIRVYRWSLNYRKGLPVTPFALTASVLIVPLATILCGIVP